MVSMGKGFGKAFIKYGQTGENSTTNHPVRLDGFPISAKDTKFPKIGADVFHMDPSTPVKG